MTLKEVKEKAKGKMGYCVSCDVCDGRECKNLMPGPGAKGSGKVSIDNYETWKKIHLNIDTINDDSEIDTSIELFGNKFNLPVFAAPIGNVRMHYGKLYKEEVYFEKLVSCCKNAGICAWTGDSADENTMKTATDAIKNNDGIGIPTIKPWEVDVVNKKLELVKNSNAFAFAMDVDSLSLRTFNIDELKVKSYSVNDLNTISKSIGKPFIVKGIMTVNGAKKAIDAGAKGIVVSNHGGRSFDEVPATADVLKEIADFAKGKCKIFVDGGIRNGMDVFKALALGADAVLIGRPFTQMVYGDADEGVGIYVKELERELKEAMLMCGAKKISDINYSMVRITNYD